MSPAWRTALRRGAVPIVLGIACLIAAIPAIEDLDPLLRGLGIILVVLGLIITVATGRTLTAEERRIGPRV
jgi:peptidoglycan/LPS O-acetylase OafA/YrhL